jgi:predicted dehydrogenase
MSGPRVVIVGAGAQIARVHLQGLRAIQAQVVGVQDLDLDRAARVGEQLGCESYRDLDDLLAQPADLAVVLTPHPFHAQVAIACLEAGRHVLVEKPMADEVAEADRMLETARRSQRLLAVAFQHRTRPEVRAARELIQSGAFGQLQRADVLGTWPRRITYFSVAPWRGSWRGEGGGVLVNQGQHDLDLLTYLAGPPRRVVGWTRTRMHHIETEDTAVASAEWESGAVGSIHISTCEVDEKQRIELTGTGARLRIMPGRLEIVRNEMDFREFAASEGDPFSAPRTLPLETVVGTPPDHVGIYHNLARAMAGQEALVAPAEEAMATLELANAIMYSSATGAQVSLPLDRQAYAAFLAERRQTTAAGH